MGVGQKREGAVYAGESIGMLTLEGRSPREVMESQMFESMQQWSAGGANISFNEEGGETDPSSSFQQQVTSLEDILRKVRNIQGHQQQSDLSSPLNLFLEQLIAYRLALWNSPSHHYSPMVRISQIGEEQQENEKFMRTLLSSASMKEYMLGLEGVQVSASPILMGPLLPLLHHNLRIINLTHNNLATPPALSSKNRL